MSLNWGRVDIGGPLNVLSPLNLTSLSSLSSLASLGSSGGDKIIFHVTWRLDDNKLEFLLLPVMNTSALGSLTGFASGLSTGSSSIHGLTTTIGQAALSTGEDASPALSNEDRTPLQLYAFQSLSGALTPSTNNFRYAQMGLRYTSIFGPVDFGAQYFYGRKSNPAMDMSVMDSFNTGSPMMEALSSARSNDDVDAAVDMLDPLILYNPYHQLGLDLAWGLWGFNFRAEAAANITYDILGNDPSVYNPNLGFALGFDRELFWDITLLFQVNQTVTLLYGNIDTSEDSIDTERETTVSSTMLFAVLSRSFFDGKLSATLVGVVSFGNFFEKTGFGIIPTLSYSQDKFSVNLTFGILGGHEDSIFGALKDSSFVSMGLGFSF
jgi:hypothetical protein